jgi:hypothetical protein
MSLSWIFATLGAVLGASSTFTGGTADSADTQSVLGKLNEFGPEALALVQRTGIWDVTITSWEKPGATPVVLSGLVAERRMVGPMLEEVLHPVAGASGANFSSADFLTFNRLEGRWQYMSMDGRVPNGMITAYSLNADPEQRIFMSFLPFANADVIGTVAIGQLRRMEQIIARKDENHEAKYQYFTVAGSAPTKWLGVRYSYTRRR